MTLKDYYKAHLYDYAYNEGYKGGLAKNANPTGYQSDIYWQDEMDFYICADYYGSFVGGIEDWTADDINFLKALGFVPEDFEESENA